MNRWIIGGLSVAAMIFAPAAMGSCLPLPTAELRELDRQVETRPEEAIRLVSERLTRTGRNASPVARSQLLAVLADAFTEQSRIDEAKVTVASARAGLQTVTYSPDAERLRLRLDLLDDQLLIASSKSSEALVATQKRLTELAGSTLERACALSMQSVAHDYLRQPDLAVGEALEAFRIAKMGHWVNAELEAAETLARVFSQAGLYPQAERMIAVVIAIGEADHRTALLSTAEYEHGILLVKARRFHEGRDALERSKLYAMQIGDRFSVAASNASYCWALIREGDFESAEGICAGGDEDLAAGQREDLLTQLIGNRAHLDLVKNRPAAAVAKLNTILTPALHALLPGSEAPFYLDRALALNALHRVNEANADLLHMHELEEAADIVQRNQQVAVLSAIIASDDLAASNQRLLERIRQEQGEAVRQRHEQTLLAASGMVITSLLGYLLWISQRHSRELRRQEIIMRTAGRNAPDAFLLLDERRRVRFANRSLYGHGPMPAVGDPVVCAVPSAVAPLLNATIEEAFQRQTVVNFVSTLEVENATARQIEMCVVPAIDRGQVVGGTLRAIDVTDHRALERGVVDGASHERQRLSGELHEGLGQQLAGILMLLGNASRVVRRGLPNASQLIDEIARYVQDSIDATRELARHLAPVKIGMGSFSTALENLVAESQRLLQIRISAEFRLKDFVLADLAADHLYCICREAIRNAALHGHCKEVVILVWVDQDTLLMSIADDGNGGANAESDLTGMGIDMMKYRAQLLGGNCTINARPGGGTFILVSVALSRISLN